MSGALMLTVGCRIRARNRWLRRCQLAVLAVSCLGSAFAASAASFSQTVWSGGASTAAATHGTNQTGWTQFRDKNSDLLVINNGGDLGIAGMSVFVEHTTSTDFAVAPGMVFHTSDADFNAGTLNNVEVSGGSVRLAPGQTTGIYTSPVIDTGAHLGYKRLFFTISRPLFTRITRQGEVDSFMMLGIRTSADGVSWSPWVGYANSFFLLTEGNKRYFQYKAQLDTVDPAVTPLLQDVTITFLNYPAATDADVICTTGTPCDGHVQLAASSNSGIYESSIIDLVRPRQLLTIDFDRVVPGGASANLLVRAGSAANPQFEAGKWTDWLPIAAGGDSIASLGTYQYVQYKVELARNSGATPTLDRVRVNYVGDPVAGAQVSLISSSFDTGFSDAYIGAIEWVESLAQNTEVRLQIATAADQATLENPAVVFVGPDGTGATWWNSSNSPSNGGCFKPGNATVVACSVMPANLRDGVNDRWFAYKVTLVANNNANPVAPTVSSIVVPYGNGVPAGVVVSPTSGLVTSESGGTAVFGVVLNAAPVAPVTVSLAVNKPDEVRLSTSSVTFTSANWTTVQFVTVTGKDDDDLDGDQTVTISTAIAGGSDAAFIGLDVADVVVINTDNDTLTATIVATDVNASETGQDSATFTLSLNSVAASPVQVGYVLSGSAVAGTDYIATPASPVTISTGAASAIITITPIDDLAIEGAESVIALLTVGNGYVIGAPNSATITLFDDEETPLPTVTVAASSTNARESDLQPGLFTISRSGVLGAPLAVFYTVSGTATPGADYIAMSGVAVIPGSMSNVVLSVAPLDDTLADPAETVVLTLGEDANYLVGTLASATVTVTDNDDSSIPVVTIAATASTASESGPQPGVFTISRTGSTDAALAVFFSVGGSATSITDYQALGGSVIIPAGSSSVVLSLAPLADSNAESDETVMLTLVAGPGYAIGATASATVTIADTGTASAASGGGAVGPADVLLLWLCGALASRRRFNRRRNPCRD
ncbi:MAG: Na-Ca exchanger/integrin-beta4 [Gammaproteobacteria bacterium]|nr:MAG: Na-Ca exchanger/integrin-beta4 [Gammaproteobacteria bacterium]TND02276.1 MAG: Na-Ca exchanger/integrin-beta4 [Gammaproteobacteria bacterium]